MKKLIYKLTLIGIISLIIFTVILYISQLDSARLPVGEMFNCVEYITVNNGPDQIKPVIDKVREKNGKTKLILGDSVCKQMYEGIEPFNEDTCVAGCNQAISMSGQYILLKEFLESHENVSDVWMIIHPSSIFTDLSKELGYIYGILPYVEKEDLNYLDNETIIRIEKSFGAFSTNTEFAEFVDKSAVGRKLYLNLLKDYGTIKPAGDEPHGVKYLKKMKYLCDEKDIEMHLLPVPINDLDKTKEMVEGMPERFQKNGLDVMFPDFCRRIHMYPIEQFGDGSHFAVEYITAEEFINKTNEIFEGDSFLEKINMQYF